MTGMGAVKMRIVLMVMMMEQAGKSRGRKDHQEQRRGKDLSHASNLPRCCRAGSGIFSGNRQLRLAASMFSAPMFSASVFLSLRMGIQNAALHPDLEERRHGGQKPLPPTPGPAGASVH
ncbi:MAG: hypothetical protein ACP5FH_04315 [Terracidiphilus sp.]